MSLNFCRKTNAGMCSKYFKLLIEIVIVSSSGVIPVVRYALREGTKGIFDSLAYAIPRLLSIFSLFLSRSLYLALYKVRGVRAARKINNYEARGDDSNAEIKVSSSKIILPYPMI